jgi:hypothetical protein
MPLHHWIRRHSGGIVARVDQTAFQRWTASIWQGQQRIGNTSDSLDSLTQAQSTADRMLQAQVPHKCSAATCGDWIIADASDK